MGWAASFTWIDWMAVGLAVVLVVYGVWAILRLRALEWPNLDEEELP